MLISTDVFAPDRLSSVADLLGAMAVKSTFVLLLGVAAVLLARGASAATRHVIWALALAGALVAPVIGGIVPTWNLPVAGWPLPHAGHATTAPAVLPAISGPSSNVVLALAPRIVAATVARAEPSDVRRAPAVLAGAGERDAAVAAPRAATAASRVVVTVPSTTSAAAMPEATLTSLGRSVWASLVPWIVAVWLIGVIVALVPTVLASARLALLARRARPLRGGRWALLVPSALREIGVRRRVRFIEMDGAVMPMTWGVRRPVVLVPADDFESTIEQRLDVLRHELAHVRRYDCLTQLLGQLACALHWYNPLVWLAARQLRIERERACDDEVLQAGARASDYAGYLLRVARAARVTGAAAFGGLAMARPSQLTGRLLAVLDDRRQRERLTGAFAVRASAVAALVVILVASAAPTSASAHGAELTGAATSTSPQRETITIASRGFGTTPVALDLPAATTTPSALAPVAEAPAANLPFTSGDASAIAVALGVSAAPCDSAARKNGNSSHTSWTSNDDGAKRWRVMWSKGDCSYEIEARGEIRYNRDVTDVESISSGGSFTIEEHIGDDTRRLVIRPGADGALERTYSVNGARQEFDAAARTWFAEALIALDRRTAFAVDQRVPAILDRAGVDGVLQEITLVESDYARRRYYTKLLSLRRLDPAQVRRVVEQAGASMSSDYELAELLVALAKLDAFDDSSHPAFVGAAKNIGSDYERRRALNALLQQDRLAAATVQALLEAASSIGSDYELATLMIDVSKRYAINDQTRPIYIKTLGSIGSDYEHRRVLSTIMASGGLTPTVTRALLEDARRIESDYELAEFLVQVAAKGMLDATTRDAYFAAADEIGSDYEHHRALSPLLKRDLLTKEIAQSVLASAAKIESDYECASLLVEVANAITIDDELRPAFEKAADTIEGQYEYGRAMSAVRRRVTR